MTLPALQLHAEDLHVRAPNTPAPASMMQEGMEHLYAAPQPPEPPGSSELDEERGHGGENGGGATQPSRLPLQPVTAPPPRYGSKPDQQSVARLFELLPKRDRDRFGKWALDHMVGKALPSGNGAITLVPLDGFEWADLRAAFDELGILVGNQLAERTRADGRTPRVWIDSPQPTDPAQQLLDPPISDFRTVALAWIDGEVRSLRSATP